ncbi:hypothetical protein LIER_22115 [Lithospermum erythrorhizon]|uniref:Uncharacterized protein n=1 Tax=Lithospermum erythrorhizon TaxID=34254 RepID=A0AAV3QSL9_LITER
MFIFSSVHGEEKENVDEYSDGVNSHPNNTCTNCNICPITCNYPPPPSLGTPTYGTPPPPAPPTSISQDYNCPPPPVQCCQQYAPPTPLPSPPPSPYFYPHGNNSDVSVLLFKELMMKLSYSIVLFYYFVGVDNFFV